MRLGRRDGTFPAGGVTPGNQGRFDGFDVLSEVRRWDLATAGVVLARISPDRELRFFTKDEEPTARALFDLLLGQHDEPKVPVTEMVDVRLKAGETDGWRYEDMPEDGDAWHQSLGALDKESLERFGRRFHELDVDDQGGLVQEVQDAKEWNEFNAKHLWSLWTRYACAAFYSHPWAWNEIGFGGPAYPRGYKNIGVEAREEWETQERDAMDPVPWASKVERAKKEHAARVSESTPGGSGDETLIGSSGTIIGSDGNGSGKDR
ncbi:MAG TPA: gluconate 2-dehydrogenase subunit 3 family protein [Acidimicrobiales bacterium]|nr:gluconate 2-dehydrogenase subunit 3 family protein [Acidimicrobiales bacterium]